MALGVRYLKRKHTCFSFHHCWLLGPDHYALSLYSLIPSLSLSAAFLSMSVTDGTCSALRTSDPGPPKNPSMHSTFIAPYTGGRQGITRVYWCLASPFCAGLWLLTGKKGCMGVAGRPEEPGGAMLRTQNKLGSVSAYSSVVTVNRSIQISTS